MSSARIKPFSLRFRFLLATAVVVLVLSLAYGMVAVVGYVVSFDNNSYRIMRSESNLFYTLAQWHDGKLTITPPKQLQLNFPTLVFIYGDDGKLLWQRRDVPEVRTKIRPEWLRKSGYYEVDTNNQTSRKVLGNDNTAQNHIYSYDNDGHQTFTHLVAVNRYNASDQLPALTIVMVDSMPQELLHSDVVWSWFSYVLLLNLLLVVPLLWLAANWSLRHIAELAFQVRELETGRRQTLDPRSPQELRGLVRNLNLLLDNERKRYTRYRTTLTDLAHSLKTPLSVLQSTLRSLRGGKNISIEVAESIMLEQISRISQQIAYYLNRASMQDHSGLKRNLHSVSALLDGLCSALNKVYQRKGVTLTLDISPEITFVGEQNDFMEVMGNILDNACKYCLEFVEVTSRLYEDTLCLVVDDDGPGIPESQRDIVFIRGQRVDTLRPGQGLGLAVAREILEQYSGDIHATSSPLGGTRMTVRFHRQSIDYNE